MSELSSAEGCRERNSSSGSIRVREMELVQSSGNRLRRLLWRDQEGSTVESIRTRMVCEL
jgi:hypothetical protein